MGVSGRGGEGIGPLRRGKEGGDVEDLLCERVLVQIANRISSITGIAQTTLEESDEEDDE